MHDSNHKGVARIIMGLSLRAMLLTSVEVSTRAYPEKYSWTTQIALLLSFFEKHKGHLLLRLHRSYLEP